VLMVVPTAGTITLQEVTYTQLLIEHLAQQQYLSPSSIGRVVCVVCVVCVVLCMSVSVCVVHARACGSCLSPGSAAGADGRLRHRCTSTR
jgi:hypothetical protein